jgi:hypothetical protein
MNISYFQRKNKEEVNWDNITRDERFFCFELYQSLKADQKGLLTLIKEGIIRDKHKDGCINNQKELEFLETIESKKFDIGVEVCFYRDLLKWNEKGIKKYKNLSQKRTFDLALFSEDAIIIIEAKAQQGFDTKQLESFLNDEDQIEILFNIIKKNKPKIFNVGLHSSKYTPGSKTKCYFDSIIKWKDIAEKYQDSKDLFIHADNIYPNEKDFEKSKPV